MKNLSYHPHVIASRHLDVTLRDSLKALAMALAPYAVAALCLFAYHEQWFR